MKREPGFYWIKVKALSTAPNIPIKFSSYPNWTPAYWTGTCFWLEDEDYSEDDCAAIYEQRIIEPPDAE